MKSIALPERIQDTSRDPGRLGIAFQQLRSQQASDSTTKVSYELAWSLLLVYNVEVGQQPFVLWRTDQIAISAMQNKIVLFMFFAEWLPW